MKKIDDISFLKFLTNQMSHSEQIDVEASLRQSGEGSSILACASAIWDTTPNATEIVGDVKSKNISEKERFENSEDSIEANEPIKESEMIQLTKKDGDTIKKITEAYVSSMNPEISLEENLKNFYMNECPGVFPEDAEAIIQKIKEGVTSFDSALAAMVAADDFQVTTLTNDMLEGKSLEDKYTILINLLVALQSLQAEGESSSESFEQIKDRIYTAGVPVTEDMVAEVTSKIEEVLANGTCTMVSVEAMNELVKSVSEGEETVKTFITDHKALFYQKMIISTAIMVGANNEQFESLAGLDVSPEVIGSGVSAGLEQQKLMAEVQNGKTTLDYALKILKYIGGAALICAGIYWGFNLIMALSGAVTIGAMSVFGTSTTACLLSALAAISLVTLPLSKEYSNDLEYIVERLGEFYDWAVSKVRGKKQNETDFVDWMNFKVETGEIVENDIETGQQQTVLA